ncbi:ATP synthase subunit I [Pedobacter arcticus]|uniref:ATP synthase subunit I n=1 Tax=Pedobacter arcticus TaxID=752140 RepID=UPI00030D8A3B|nr:ATP synthase subunit I [Pedobacter arcticus]
MIVALISGFGLGILFFGGLWITVKKTIGENYMGLWIAASSIIRIGITLTGFYFVAQGNIQRLLVCIASFIATRFLVLWLTAKYDQKLLISKAKQS